ncbi:outer membrane protein assembly factor BamB family protein [Pelagibacterium lacus]|uniref:outer membrane protein assembly factor BamB family protein n=1 Tax=Pelagibacterium lacus TaxID=2282655 RepID=UPI001314F422|nr:PQQ-binding-like beta-propeller repeat protein [Pelagibacterium lacus]
MANAGAREVTADRLLHARDEPQNWLMHLGSYDGARYSGLDAINAETVSQLVELYSVPLGGLLQGGGSFQDALPISPLVEDGFLYIVDGNGRVNKLDAHRRGAVVWRNDAGQRDLDSWLEPSRGLAFHGDYVIATSADGHLHWIDKETGETARSVAIGDPTEGYTIVAPPLVAGDRIIVGGGGFDRGAAGRIDAIDAETGDHLWRVDTLAEGGAPGPIGGGTIFQTGVYDPATGLTVWGTGAPVPRFAPFAGDAGASRSNSAIAIDVETGAVRWHFQYVPGSDPNGFSEAGTHQLAALDGADPVLMHFGNNGYAYALDMADGSLRSATGHVLGPLWPGVDPLDGRPETGEGGGLDTAWANRADCPNILGDPAYVAAFSPRTGLAYGAGADGCLTENLPVIKTYSAPGWLGAYYAGAAGNLGMLSAIDPQTGALVAQRLFDFPVHGGALATAGGLVFAMTAEGTLHALDEETLEPVWSRKFGSLAPIPPVTFEVDGQQRIAIVVGGNAFTPDLSYRPPEMGISEPIFVLVVLGLRS